RRSCIAPRRLMQEPVRLRTGCNGQMPFNRSSNMQTFRTVAVVAVLAIAGPAWAHHPFDSEFDINAPVKLSGKVTKVYWSEPHVVFQLGVADAGGQVRQWNCEA